MQTITFDLNTTINKIIDPSVTDEQIIEFLKESFDKTKPNKINILIPFELFPQILMAETVREKLVSYLSEKYSHINIDLYQKLLKAIQYVKELIKNNNIPELKNFLADNEILSPFYSKIIFQKLIEAHSSCQITDTTQKEIIEFILKQQATKFKYTTIFTLIKSSHPNDIKILSYLLDLSINFFKHSSNQFLTVKNYFFYMYSGFPIHLSVWENSIEITKMLLTKDKTLANQVGSNGLRPIHIAKSIAMVDLLLSHGATLENDENGRSVLHYAADLSAVPVLKYYQQKFTLDVNQYKSVEHPIVRLLPFRLSDQRLTAQDQEKFISGIEFFLNNNFNINSGILSCQSTLLHVACKLSNQIPFEIIKILCERFSADLQSCNIHGLLPIHIAIKSSGNTTNADRQSAGVNLVKYFLEKGLSPEIKTKNDKDHTLFQYTISVNNLPVAKFLEDKTNFEIPNCHHCYPIHIAALYQYKDIFIWLLTKDKNYLHKPIALPNGETALNQLIRKGALDIIQYLIDHNFDLKLTVNHYETAFYCAQTKVIEKFHEFEKKLPKKNRNKFSEKEFTTLLYKGIAHIYENINKDTNLKDEAATSLAEIFRIMYEEAHPKKNYLHILLTYNLTDNALYNYIPMIKALINSGINIHDKTAGLSAITLLILNMCHDEHYLKLGQEILIFLHIKNVPIFLDPVNPKEIPKIDIILLEKTLIYIMEFCPNYYLQTLQFFKSFILAIFKDNLPIIYTKLLPLGYAVKHLFTAEEVAAISSLSTFNFNSNFLSIGSNWQKNQINSERFKILFCNGIFTADEIHTDKISIDHLKYYLLVLKIALTTMASSENETEKLFFTNIKNCLFKILHIIAFELEEEHQQLFSNQQHNQLAMEKMGQFSPKDNFEQTENVRITGFSNSYKKIKTSFENFYKEFQETHQRLTADLKNYQALHRYALDTVQHLLYISSLNTNMLTMLNTRDLAKLQNLFNILYPLMHKNPPTLVELSTLIALKNIGGDQNNKQACLDVFKVLTSHYFNNKSLTAQTISDYNTSKKLPTPLLAFQLLQQYSSIFTPPPKPKKPIKRKKIESVENTRTLRSRNRR